MGVLLLILSSVLVLSAHRTSDSTYPAINESRLHKITYSSDFEYAISSGGKLKILNGSSLDEIQIEEDEEYLTNGRVLWNEQHKAFVTLGHPIGQKLSLLTILPDNEKITYDGIDLSNHCNYGIGDFTVDRNLQTMFFLCDKYHNHSVHLNFYNITSKEMIYSSLFSVTSPQLLLTEHNEIRYLVVSSHPPMICDLRNVLKPICRTLDADHDPSGDSENDLIEAKWFYQPKIHDQILLVGGRNLLDKSQFSMFLYELENSSYKYHEKYSISESSEWIMTRDEMTGFSSGINEGVYRYGLNWTETGSIETLTSLGLVSKSHVSGMTISRDNTTLILSSTTITNTIHFPKQVNSSTSTTAISPPNNGTNGEPKGTDALNVGIIIGIVSGFCVLFFCSMIIIYCCVRKIRKKNRKTKEEKGKLIESKNSKVMEMINVSTVPRLHNIQVGEKLGSGNFGEVYIGIWNETQVALKKLQDEEDLINFQKEEDILFKIGNHPSITQFLGKYLDEETSELYLVLEYVKSGSLDSFLTFHQFSLKTIDLMNMIISCAKGMLFLANKKISHGDLACRNLLVYKIDDQYSVKISDFGMAKSISGNYYKDSSNREIPVRWVAPEILSSRSYNEASDVWSFGITCWEIFSFGKVPYAWLSNRQVTEEVPRGERLGRPDDCPEDMWNVMQSCWTMNPKERPNFETLVHQLNDIYQKMAEFNVNIPVRNSPTYSSPSSPSSPNPENVSGVQETAQPSNYI